MLVVDIYDKKCRLTLAEEVREASVGKLLEMGLNIH